MYCPKCGQSQSSADAQFCNRCGMSLNMIKEIVLNDGMAVKTCSFEWAGISRFQRQKGMRFGAKLVFWGLAFVPPTLGFSLITNTPPIFFLLSLIVVLAGICRMVYARVFEETDAPRQSPQFVVMQSSALTNSLETYPSANLFGTRPRAATPPSVTDHTTRLLD